MCEVFKSPSEQKLLITTYLGFSKFARKKENFHFFENQNVTELKETDEEEELSWWQHHLY